MKNLNEAVKEAFEFIETKYSPKWRGGKGSKENLIKALSQIEEPVHIAAGYKGSDGFRHAFGRALPNINKPTSVEWRTWVLSLIGVYYCNSCKLCVPLKEKARGRCKLCDKSNPNKTRIANRKLLYQYLSNNSCTDCGEDNPIVLEFDHKDPSVKEYNISNMMGYSWSKIQLEIDKCEVVCANCHRKRTAIQQNWYSWLNN